MIHNLARLLASKLSDFADPVVMAHSIGADHRACMLTASGAVFNLAEPELTIKNVTVRDYATHLSHISRFCGALNHRYSVADHLVYVSYLVPPHLAGQGFMHDGHEALCLDVHRPMKVLLPDYRRVERRIERAFRKHFGMPMDFDPLIKIWDDYAANIERSLLIPEAKLWPRMAIDPASNKLPVMHETWEDSRDAWLDRFYELNVRRIGCN